MGQTNSIGYVTQSAIDVAGTVSAPLYGVRGFTDPPQVEPKVPHYMTGQVFNQGSIFVNTRRGQTAVDLDITPANLLPLLEAGLGAASSGAVLAGVGVLKYLTLKYQEGLVQYWTAINQLCNTLEVTYTLTDGFQAKASLVGPYPTVTASAWSTVAPLPTALVPFASWQVYLTLADVVYCVRRMRILIDNKMEPQYCSPSAEPDDTTPAGLTPNTYVRGDGEVTVEIEARYDADAASEYEKFRQQTVSGRWVITALDPSTDATAVVRFTVPRLGYTAGSIDRGKTNWQVMSGTALQSTSDGTNLLVYCHS
jgi:hypothetical protein